jgi:hypothetical protein
MNCRKQEPEPEGESPIRVGQEWRDTRLQGRQTVRVSAYTEGAKVVTVYSDRWWGTGLRPLRVTTLRKHFRLFRLRHSPKPTDAERLDWLEREGHTLCYYGQRDGHGRWQIPDWDEGTTPREAIDAAMREQAESATPERPERASSLTVPGSSQDVAVQALTPPPSGSVAP